MEVRSCDEGQRLRLRAQARCLHCLSFSRTSPQRLHGASAAGKTAVGEPRPEGEYDKAIADLTEAIRREPHSAVAYTNRARAFLAAKLFDKAMADLEQAVRLDPLDAKARLVRGDVWRREASPRTQSPNTMKPRSSIRRTRSHTAAARLAFLNEAIMRT